MNDEYQWLGGNVVLDFINTLGGDRRGRTEEYLCTIDDVLRWAEKAEILTTEEVNIINPEEAMDNQTFSAAFKNIIKQRELLANLFNGIVEGHMEGASLDLFNFNLQNVSALLQLEKPRRVGDPFKISLPVRSPSPMIIGHRLIWEAKILLTSPDIWNLGRCSSSTCSWLFLDSTKNKRRQYCSSSLCGNRERVRKYREKSRVH